MQASGLETFGDRIFVTKTDPDAILGYSGISTKVFDEIIEVANSFKFPALEVEEVVEPVKEENVTETETPEVIEEPVVEVEPVSEAEDEDEAEPVEEKSFEELLKMESDRRSSLNVEEDDDMRKLIEPKKKKGKKRGPINFEYDPDNDTDIIHRHRRDEDDWDNWS